MSSSEVECVCVATGKGQNKRELTLYNLVT